MTATFKKLFWVLLFLSCVTGASGDQRETAVVRVARKVSPAVVNVSSEYLASGRHPFYGDPVFEWFFRDFFEAGPERPQQRTSLGSGVIIDGKQGFILTNAHVIANAGKISVMLNDEQEFEAAVVGADSESDLAVLRIQSPDTLPSVEMGTSDDLMIGEEVIAIGNPFGFSHTVTRGVISALNRSVRVEDTVYYDFIQTDASINPGNSGGPLLNINGDLIGINTAIYAKAQGIGFAIPINKARRIVSDLIQYGEVSETWVGLTIQNINPRMALYLNIPENSGVLVKKIDAGSPGQNAGIQEGDVLLSLGGITLRSVRDFNAAMKGVSPGDTVKISLRRNGKIFKYELKAGVFPPDLAEELAYELIGVSVTDSQVKSGGAVISKLRPHTYLAEIGARPGDVIRQMDETPIRNAGDFIKTAVKYRHKGSVVILLYRGGQGYYITVKL